MAVLLFLIVSLALFVSFFFRKTEKVESFQAGTQAQYGDEALGYALKKRFRGEPIR